MGRRSTRGDFHERVQVHPEVRGALIERFAAGVSTERREPRPSAQDGQGLAHPWSAEGEGEYADFAEAVERAREAARERPGPMNEDELARVVSRWPARARFRRRAVLGDSARRATANPWTPLAEFWTNWRRDVPAELDAFKRFCREELTTDLGEPLIVEPFQEEIVGPFLEGCRTNVAIVSKKNGKSSLCGAIGLFVLCSLPDCSIAVVASARDQAQYVLDQARLYVRRNPRLRERLRIVERAIPPAPSGARCWCAPRTATRLTVGSVMVAICDELGRWSS